MTSAASAISLKQKKCAITASNLDKTASSDGKEPMFISAEGVLAKKKGQRSKSANKSTKQVVKPHLGELEAK